MPNALCYDNLDRLDKIAAARAQLYAAPIGNDDWTSRVITRACDLSSRQKLTSRSIARRFCPRFRHRTRSRSRGRSPYLRPTPSWYINFGSNYPTLDKYSKILLNS